MGQEINSHRFVPEDFQCFQQRLLDNLTRLKCMLNTQQFAEGPVTIGAELELYLVDKYLRPLLLNREVIERSGNKQLALELNRFNLEYNLSPVSALGKPFSAIESEMLFAIEHVNEQLIAESGCALPIGILPTLKRSDFGIKAMTDESRFFALTQSLRHLRGRMFRIHIEGEDPLSLRSHDVTLEGANSSMQVHLRVPPAEFADTFNACQLITPIIVGLAANSPFMLGHKLWHETRIPLFSQAIDGRSHEDCKRGVPSRVDFGNGWIREGVYELFAEMVHVHPVILPIDGDERSSDIDKKSGVADLTELRVHTGSVWPWNRAVYDPQAGGHFRIEMRAMPAGPTPCDMAANAAFAIGLTRGLKENMQELIPAFPFAVLSRNFYEAAEKGIGAQLMWPNIESGEGLQKRPLLSVAKSLFSTARKGLVELGVEKEEADYYLDIIEKRILTGTNGAIWQRKEYQRLCRGSNASQALKRMMQKYMMLSAQNIPVSQWCLSARKGA